MCHQGGRRERDCNCIRHAEPFFEILGESVRWDFLWLEIGDLVSANWAVWNAVFERQKSRKCGNSNAQTSQV